MKMTQAQLKGKIYSYASEITYEKVIGSTRLLFSLMQN